MTIRLVAWPSGQGIGLSTSQVKVLGFNSQLATKRVALVALNTFGWDEIGLTAYSSLPQSLRIKSTIRLIESRMLNGTSALENLILTSHLHIEPR